METFSALLSYVTRIPWSSLDFPPKGPVMQSLDFLLALASLRIVKFFILWRIWHRMLSLHTSFSQESSFSQLKQLHNMMTSSNGNIFCVTGPLCGEFTDDRWIPAHRPVTRKFDVSFNLRLNKRLRKQSSGWWFETPSCPLWRQSWKMRCEYMKTYIPLPLVFVISEAVVVVIKYRTWYNLHLVIFLHVCLDQLMTFSPNACKSYTSRNLKICAIFQTKRLCMRNYLAAFLLFNKMH